MLDSGMAHRVSLICDFWQTLGDMAFEHKALYVVLTLIADSAGVVNWCLEDISGMAGHKFHASDLLALGPLVIRLDERRLLLPDYLRNQTRTLSDGCKAHRPVFAAIHKHWGNRRKDGTEPIIEAWQQLKISGKLPLFNDIYQSDKPVPKWLQAHRDLADRAKAVTVPSNWPELVRNDCAHFMEMRYEQAMAKLSKVDCHKWTWSPLLARNFISMIGNWLDVYPVSNVSRVLSLAAISSYLTPLHPDPKRHEPKLHNDPDAND